MTLWRKVESACPGETNLARFRSQHLSILWMKYKVFFFLCLLLARDLGEIERHELEWLLHQKTYRVLLCDSVTEIWRGQKAFNCLYKRLFQNLAGGTRMPAASQERLLGHAVSDRQESSQMNRCSLQRQSHNEVCLR